MKIIRIASGKNTTLSHLYINGIFCCYLLEDSIREDKIAGITCIPEGRYQLQLNTQAGMNSRYRTRYPEMHKGMLEITGIPDFKLVFIHIGNYHTETLGCPLTGTYWQLAGGDYQMMQSAAAYQQVYAKLLREIKAGRRQIEVLNQLVTS